MVSAASSSFLIFFVIFLYVYLSFRVQRYYMELAREVTRLKSISTTPIIQQFKENLEGAASVRFYQKGSIQFQQYTSKIDDYQKNSITLAGAQSWFNIIVSLLSLLVLVPTVIIAVIMFSRKMTNSFLVILD